MHRRLGSVTLSQLAFPGESNLNFSWENSNWDNTVVKKKKKKHIQTGACLHIRIRNTICLAVFKMVC